MDKIVEYLNSIINENIISIECCSRLFHKNIVFKVITDTKTYAIKIYLNGPDAQTRFNNEIYFYKLFLTNHLIHVPKIYHTLSAKIGNVVIMEWLDGQSLKKIVKNSPVNAINFIKNMLSDMESIWLINDQTTKKILNNDEPGLSKRINLPDQEILKKIISFKPDIDFTEIFIIYKHLLTNLIPNNKYIINSDVSMHEYIISNNQGYWIDLERFRLGDPNNDLARAFQSLTNSIFHNNLLYAEIFDLFSNNKFYNKESFTYYLTEKLLTSIYVAPDQISDEEINYYISFIKKIYYSDNDFHKKKQRFKSD